VGNILQKCDEKSLDSEASQRLLEDALETAKPQCQENVFLHNEIKESFKALRSLVNTH